MSNQSEINHESIIIEKEPISIMDLQSSNYFSLMDFL